MASFREVTDPAELAGIFGNAAPSASGASAAPQGRTAGPQVGREITDPAQIASIFGGQPQSFDERFGTGPMASATDISSGLGEGVRRKADEMLVGKPNAQNIAAAGTLNAINSAGMNIPRAVGSAIQSLPGVGNGQSYRQNYEAAKERQDAYDRQAPYAAGLGMATGIVGGALALPSVQAAKGAGMLGRAGANAATGAIYGGLTEAVDSQGDLAKTAAGAGVGLGAGAALTPVAEGVASLVGRGVSALQASPMFARGAQVQKANGELTETAKYVLKQAGIDAADLSPEARQQMAAAFSVKGESEPVAREALASGYGLSLSRGQATGDARALAYEQAAMAGDKGSKAQAAAQAFRDRQQADLAAATRNITDRVSGGVRAENPTQAAEAIADQARAYRVRVTAETDSLQAQADDALARLRGATPLEPADAVSVVRDGLRDRAAQSRAAYKAEYDNLAQMPGEFHPRAFDNLGTIIGNDLKGEFGIDRMLHPAGSKALEMLNDIPGALGLPEGVGPNARQIENFRKRFSVLSNSAQTQADREAVRLVRNAFDAKRQELAEVGLFGPRSEPVGGVGAVADDLPGIPAGGLPGAPEAIPADAIPLPKAQSGEPESLVRYLARNGGIQLTDDARAADLNRLYVPGAGTLARKNGRSLDDLRVNLVEQGFFPPDEMGGASARDVSDKIMEAIRAERAGRPTYRMDDEARAGGQRALDRVASENADNAAMIDRQSRRIEIDMEGYGLRPQDLDRTALREAAEAMVRGEADDAATAYDRAVSRRSLDAGDAASVPRSPSDDVPFPELGERGTTAPAGSVFPAATPEGTAYAEREGIARGLFSEHRGKFGAQNRRDDVGRTVEDLIALDLEPSEFVRRLYGPNAGKNARVADHLKSVIGENSPEWPAYQSGYVSSIINGRDMSARAIDARIGVALSGDRRGLTYRVLTGEQVAAMRQFQTAVQRSESARQAVPEWIETLGRSDFDPNKIVGDLLGAGVPGSRVGSGAYASTLKAFVGADSPAWMATKGATFRRLVETPDGSAQLPPRVIAQRIEEFTSGKGAGLAKQMFTAEELAHIKSFGNAVKSMTTPDGTPKVNGGGPTLQKVASHALDGLAAALGYSVGGLPGAAAVYTGKFGSKMLLNNYQGRAARKAFEGGAPNMLPPPGPVLDLRPVGVGSGLSAEYAL